MNDSSHVLIVEDDAGQAEMLAEFLRLSGLFTAQVVGTLQAMYDRLEQGGLDFVLLDYRLPDGTGLDGLMEIERRGFQVPVVMVTGQGDERVAVQAIQHGAADYLQKSSEILATLPALITKTVRDYQLRISMERSTEQNRYQATLLNNVRDAIVVWDLQGTITYWNPAAALLFGWNSEERVGCNVADVYLPAFTPPVMVPKEGDTIGHHIVRQCNTRNKQSIWVDSRVAVLRDTGAGNRTIGYMDIAHDITKRKEAEQALRLERNFVSAVLDTVGALVVVLDTQGRIVRLNRASEQTLGLSFAEVRGRQIWELLQTDEVDLVKQLMQRMQAGETPKEFEYHLISRLGEARLISWSNTVLTDQSGQVEYVIATGLDVTERRKAEQRLRYRLEVEQLISSISTNFINLASDQVDQGVNYALEMIGQFTGVDRSYVVQLSDDETYTSSTHEWCAPGVLPQRQNLQRLPVESQPWLVEQLLRLEPIYLRRVADLPIEAAAEKELLQFQQVQSSMIVPLAYRGLLMGFLGLDSVRREMDWAGEDIGMVRTVSEIIINALSRQRMDDQIRAAQTHLTQAARLATIGEMASGIAHQINNPLTTIIGDAQILRRSLPAGNPNLDSAEAIEQAGWRLQEVVQRLLEFSRPAAATLSSLSVNETIQRAVLLVGAHIEAMGVSLQANLEQSLPAVRGNTRQLEDLWVNLLLLARDATADGCGHSIQIISQNGVAGEIRIEVSDDGTPIPAGQLNSIFEPNFIGASCGRGTGMELSICREIVRQHSGQINVESSPAHGTIFRVILPVETQPRSTGSLGRKTGSLNRSTGSLQ